MKTMFYDLFNMIMDTNDGDTVESLQFLSDLHDELENNPSAIKDFIAEYIEEHNLCPDCFHEMDSMPHKELMGDFMGSPAYETFYEPFCPHCNDDDEEDRREDY
jgi:hypothetical protein